jgi:hypothetical protein
MAQVFLLFTLEYLRPELRDPEYGYKLARLRRRLAEAPGQPLVLVLGSSRTLMGLRPGLLPPYRTPDGAAPIVFNFGFSAASPLHELICLRRLLGAGIQPQRVFIELLPSRLSFKSTGEELVPIDRLTWSELPLLRPYSSPAARLDLRWWEPRLLPWFTYRYRLLSRYVPSLLPWSFRQDHFWTGQDSSGCVLYGRTAVTEAQYRQGVELAHAQHAFWLEHFEIMEVQDRALRELLALCRREGIGASLFLMPEGTVFQDWYSPAAQAALRAYLDRLTEDEHVSVTDARTWIADTEFADGHHLLPCGATHFTERFGCEVLRPLLEGPDPHRPQVAAVR